jgi:hypothetical protein
MDLRHAGDACFFLDDPRHLTERGHRVVAERVRASVEPLLR